MNCVRLGEIRITYARALDTETAWVTLCLGLLRRFAARLGLLGPGPGRHLGPSGGEAERGARSVEVLPSTVKPYLTAAAEQGGFAPGIHSRPSALKPYRNRMRYAATHVKPY